MITGQNTRKKYEAYASAFAMNQDKDTLLDDSGKLEVNVLWHSCSKQHLWSQRNSRC
jgi:hypothetical protein